MSLQETKASQNTPKIIHMVDAIVPMRWESEVRSLGAHPELQQITRQVQLRKHLPQTIASDDYFIHHLWN